MGGDADLCAEYRERVRGCRSQTETDGHYRWLLLERHRRHGDPAVFALLMKGPREAGAAAMYRYIRGQISALELVEQTKVETGDAYVAALQAAGLCGDMPQPEYGVLAHECHLEILKAYSDLQGLDPEDAQTCDQVAWRGSTTWFRFAESLHALLGLPPISSLRDVPYLLSPIERTILEGGDFSAYAIRDREEREALEAELSRSRMEL